MDEGASGCKEKFRTLISEHVGVDVVIVMVVWVTRHCRLVLARGKWWWRQQRESKRVRVVWSVNVLVSIY
jgi:hypothetical protein